MDTKDIELRIASYFDYRSNIVVPNISWGIGIHECDLLVVTKSGYAIEIEIKISKTDLKKDALKRHGHLDSRIKALYFAIPEKLIMSIDLIPERAGILIIHKDYCELKRKPTVNKEAKPLTPDERFKIAHLGAMRIWHLKRKIIDIKRPAANKEGRE